MLPQVYHFFRHSIVEWFDEKVLKKASTWGLWAILVSLTGLFVADIVAWDPVPLIDEALLGYLTFKVMAEIRRRRRPAIESAQRPAIEASPEA